MHYSRLRMSDYISISTQLMKKAGVHLDIRKAMSESGFALDKVKIGEQLLAILTQLDRRHNEMLNRRKLLNSERALIFMSLRKLYMKCLKIARIAFQDDTEARAVLLLDGQRARVAEGVCEQIEVFGVNLLGSEVNMRVMESFGIDKPTILDMIDQLRRYQNLSSDKALQDRQIRVVTIQKKEALLRFQKWLSSYIKIAKIKFENEPEKLQLLGLVG